MEKMMKEYMKSIAWMLAGGMTLSAFEMAGAQFGTISSAKAAFWLCAAALIGVYILSVMRMLRGGKKTAPDIAADREDAVRRQKELEDDPAAEKAAIARLERGVWLKWGGMIALFTVTGMFAGMGYPDSGIMTGVMGAAGLFLFAPLMVFALCRPKMISPAPGTELSDGMFPQLFALVREVADEAGHRRKIRMFLGEQGIGVFRAKNFDGILLPALLADFMTKSELRQVMRHEFSHLVCAETEDEYRWLTLIARMDETSEACAFCFFGMFALLPEMDAFRERVTMYRELIERKLEAQADSHKLPPDEARDAVAAIAKAAMFLRFCEEDRVSAYRCFESETPGDNQVDIRAAVFAQMLAERGKMWIEELQSEQPAQFDSHPTFSQRCEIYGVTDFDAFTRESDGEWLKEMRRLKDQENAYLAGNPDYQAMREHQYVNRRAAMEAYEKCSAPLEEMEARAVVDAAEAYFGLNTPKAMEIVRSLLETDPQNPEPKLLLGVWLLDVRDDAGLELLYEVAQNENYTRRALQEAGDYVFRRGGDDRIREYRQRSAILLQQAAEFHYHLDDFRLSDLKPRSMPEPLLEELLDEILRIGEGNISKVACAAKDFRPDEDAHVFVIGYSCDDDEKREQIETRIFDLLDRREEYYAMRDADRFSIEKLEAQVPGCIVYTKKDR